MTIAKRQAEVLRQILAGQKTELHTAMPGTVVSYDATNQVADIRPGIKRVIPATSDEVEDRVEELPILPAVPVAWPRAGTFFVHGVLVAGDGVLLVFCEADINAWLEGNTSSDPGTPERHGLSGAVAVPGLFPSSSSIGTVSSSNPKIGIDGDVNAIEFTSSQVRCGGSASLAMATGLQAMFDAISGASTTANDGGAAFKAAILAALAADPNWTNRNSTVIKGS